MTPIIRPDWWLPESAATDESIYRNRRDILKALGIGSVGAGLALSGGLPAGADTSDLYPVDRNPNFAATLNSQTMFIVRNNGYAISTPVHEQYVETFQLLNGHE